MTQIQSPKLLQAVAIGPDSDEASVSKLGMLVLLVPGTDDGTDTSVRQARTYSQIIRRR